MRLITLVVFLVLLLVLAAIGMAALIAMGWKREHDAPSVSAKTLRYIGRRNK